jgi:ureidoacrylate peracid hydrolase
MKPALIVIDMQNDFVKDTSPYSCQMLDDSLILRVKKLINFCRGKKIPIIYTQHSIKPDKSNAEIGEPKNVRACIIGTKGWEIIRKVAPRKEDIVIRKDRFSAFFNTKLENVLKNLKVDTLILCGVLTNNCVRATAEDAYYRNYKLILVSDCCGATSYVKGFTHEEVNKFTLEELKERTYKTKVVNLNQLKRMMNYEKGRTHKKG